MKKSFSSLTERTRSYVNQILGVYVTLLNLSNKILNGGLVEWTKWKEKCGWIHPFGTDGDRPKKLRRNLLRDRCLQSRREKANKTPSTP